MDAGADVGVGTAAHGLAMIAVRRVPLLALGALSLLAGLSGGLGRLGLPPIVIDLAVNHGALMTGGFLGTVIGLERAVALKRGWGYAAPVLSGVGALMLAAGLAPDVAVMLLLAASAILLAVCVRFAWQQPALFTMTIGLGALCWLAGNLILMLSGLAQGAMPWWAAFLILTIAGERLELSRLMRPSRLRTLSFFLPLALLLAGLGLSAATDDAVAAGRVFGAGLVALALWLALFDVARRTARQHGLTRYIAACLLAGYVWLALSGAIHLAIGFAPDDALYDAALHTIFIGFVFSMIFGHAPIIVPSVLNVTLPWSRWFYLHLALLHAALALRVCGDLRGWEAARDLGAAVNVAAILLFLLVSAATAIGAGRQHRARDAGSVAR
jgi:hypothetical protein